MTGSAMTKIFDTPLYPYQRSPDQDRATPARHATVVVGAGPVGLAAAIDLAQNNIPVVVLDENDKVSFGSRAICFAKRQLEILDRLGCGDRIVEKGVQWRLGKVFFRDAQVYAFDLLPEPGHKRPAFINLQQYHLENCLVERVHELQRAGRPIEIRGFNGVTGLEVRPDRVTLRVSTPEDSYELEADWLIACDGAGSLIRSLMGFDFVGQAFEDNFLIADVVMEADFPTERWFWFDPPFNRGQSALLHKQPDGVWRIDLQLGPKIDREREKAPERVIPRLNAMLGEGVKFELEWVSIYSFQCRRMEKFRHGRVLFAGDSAHQMSPFGARGANSGIQDADNLVWKLRLVRAGLAPESLLDSYDDERVYAADENILNSTRSTDFITPRSSASRAFRDAALNLSARFAFARPLVNSGRLSTPAIYDLSPLNGDDDPALPQATRPGAPALDAALGKSWLLDPLGGHFQLLGIGADVPRRLEFDGVEVEGLALRAGDDPSGALAARYLGPARQAVYLLRPDQHVAARWTAYDEGRVGAALRRAIGKA